MKSEGWDKKERKKDGRQEDIKKKYDLLEIYIPLVKKYAKLNDIKLPSEKKDPGNYLVKVYGFVWDAKFIDFAYDQSGIIFNEEMYRLDDEITDEDLKKFDDIPDKDLK